MSYKTRAENGHRIVGFPSPIATVSRFRLFLGLALAFSGSGAGAGSAAVQDLETLRGIAQNLLEAKAARPDAQVRVEINPVDPRLRLPACSRPLEAFLAPASRLIGATSVGVSCTAPKPWKIYLQGSVSVWRPVVVSTRALPRSTRVDLADVTLRKSDLGSLSGGFFTDAAELVGMQLVRSVGPDQVIIPSMLRRPLMVRRGERITLISSTGNVEVRASGRALTDGTMGERIEVEGAVDRRRLDGEVIGLGVVRMGYRR